MRLHRLITLLAIAGGVPPSPASAQLRFPTLDPSTCVTPPFYPGLPGYRPVEQGADGRVTFRLCEPDAKEVFLLSRDMPGIVPRGLPPGTPPGLAMTKDATGLWSVTTSQPVPSDTYSYSYRIDGLKVTDPQGKRFVQQRIGVSSVFEVTGPEGEFQSWQADVPHGAVSAMEYWGKSLGIRRHVHVYTPPGYMKDSRSYPVLYLLHGASGSDDSWTSLGQAHHILDNLIAAGKVVPMIVVMPDAHTPFRADVPSLDNPDFGDDLTGSLIPFIDATFRSNPTPEARAIAGESMGGSVTLRNGLPRSDVFRWIGVFSMGLGAGGELGTIESFTANHDAGLKRSAQELELVYFAMGKDDFMLGTVAQTRALFDRYGIKYTYHETGGGHDWVVWRRYLADFAPKLFR